LYFRKDGVYWKFGGPNNNVATWASLNPMGGDFRGPVLGARTGSTSAAIYNVAGSTTDSSASTGLPDTPIFVLANNSGGRPGGFSNANLRGASFGAGLPAGDWTNLRVDWDAFESALGRRAP